MIIAYIMMNYKLLSVMLISVSLSSITLAGRLDCANKREVYCLTDFAQALKRDLKLSYLNTMKTLFVDYKNWANNEIPKVTNATLITELKELSKVCENAATTLDEALKDPKLAAKIEMHLPSGAQMTRNGLFENRFMAFFIEFAKTHHKNTLKAWQELYGYLQAEKPDILRKYDELVKINDMFKLVEAAKDFEEEKKLMFSAGTRVEEYFGMEMAFLKF